MIEKEKRKNIINIIDNEDDMGEVAEWAGISAAQNKNDDDFDIENKQVFQQSSQENHVEIARQKINQKLQQKNNANKKSGPLVNNLKDKAKMLALQNSQIQDNNEQLEIKEQEIEKEKDKGSLSPDKKSLKRSSLQKIEDEFEKANQDRNLILQQKKQEIVLISFIDALDQMKGSQDIKDQIQFKEKKTSFLDKLFGCFSVHLKSSRLINEKEQVCVMSQLSFDDNNQYHFRILYTIYCSLMSTDYCQRYGNHWETIGFQGNDPATDLRGAGILALLQMLAFISDYKQYVKQCLNTLSQMSLPFCISLINITIFVLVSLKDNKLNSLINQEDSVISVINKLYFAGFHFLIKILKKEKITFHTIGDQLTIVRKYIHEQPQRLIREFQQDVQKFYKTNNV